MKKTWTWLFMIGLLQGCGGGGGGAPDPAPPVNAAPAVADQTVATNPDTVLNGTLSGTDANGDALSFSVAGNPASGSVTLSGTGNQDFEYTPNAGFAGQDSFTFTASDGAATSAEATVTINVNAGPVATGAALSTSEIVAVSGSVSATDAEGDAVTFEVTTQPSRGSVSAFDTVTGAFTYTPDDSQDGVDTFGVTASDAYQSSTEVDVTVEIFAWAGTSFVGSAAEDTATTGGLLISGDGEFVFGGSTEGQLGATALNGVQDSWLRKTDRRGNELWTVQFGNASTDFSRMIFDDPDGSGTFVVSAESDPMGATVYKFDNDGNEQLSAAVDFQGEPVMSGGYRGAIDADGDLIVLSFHNSGGSLVTKVDGANGDTLWQTPLYGSADPLFTPFDAEWQLIWVRNATFDAMGNLVVFVRYIPEPLAPPRACNLCAAMLVFDDGGNLLTTTEMNDFANACGQGLEGWMYRANFAPDGTIWGVGFGGYDSDEAFGQVTRFSADATQVLGSWCDVTGVANSQYYTPIHFLDDGSGLLIGEIEPNDGSSMDPFSEIALVKLDAGLTEVFRRRIATDKTDGFPADFRAGSINVDAQGLIYITGSTDGEFPPLVGSGDQDAFLMRLDADGNPR